MSLDIKGKLLINVQLSLFLSPSLPLNSPLLNSGVGRGKDISTITGHRGKDISTILDEERKENKRPQRAAAARRKKRRRLNDLDSDSNLDEEESEDEFKISDGCVVCQLTPVPRFRLKRCQQRSWPHCGRAFVFCAHRQSLFMFRLFNTDL